MQSVLSTIRQKWVWACQNKPFWVHALLLGLTVLFFLLAHQVKFERLAPDFLLRFWGMWLQLIGAAIVWYDLTKTASDFGVGSSSSYTWNWIKGFFRAPLPVNGRVSVDLAGAYSVASGRVRPAIDSQLAVERRLAQLELYVKSIDGELSAVHQQFSTQKQETHSEIDRQAVELRKSIGNVENLVKEAFVGNYIVLRLGAIWLVVGIVLSSVAAEITSLVKLVPRLW